MDIHEAIRNPHNLTCDRLAAFCRHVDLALDEQTIRSLPLTGIVKTCGNNRLTCLDCLCDCIGVYAFQLRGCVIYVGKCGGGQQNLKERVRQHLTVGDKKGGTLPQAWLRKYGHNHDPDNQKAAYKAEIVQSCLWTIAFRRDEDMQKIARLEHLLIGVIGPEYCDMSATLLQ